MAESDREQTRARLASGHRPRAAPRTRSRSIRPSSPRRFVGESDAGHAALIAALRAPQLAGTHHLRGGAERSRNAGLRTVRLVPITAKAPCKPLSRNLRRLPVRRDRLDTARATRAASRRQQARSAGTSTATSSAAAASTSAKKFMPDGLSKIDAAAVPDGRRGALPARRSRAAPTPTCSRLVERFIGAKMLEISEGHWLGDQVALEALVRLTDEELEAPGAVPPPRAMAAERHAGRLSLHAASPTTSPAQCSASRPGPVLALTLDIELFSQAHYRVEHRARHRALGRCGRTSSCSTGRKSRSTRSSTSSSGGASTRAARRPSASRA
mgnify:CR=1 FL=1